jgi:SP family general alpha glucoside:H+ symporter-like MFS transporter
MSNLNEKHDATLDAELNKEGVQHHETLSDKDLMANAFEAENREHEMGLWEAVKDHPMACFWAFTFCFTIVSPDAYVHTR